MNRTTLVIASVLLFLSPVFAIDRINTNIVGAAGSTGGDAVYIANANGPHHISGSVLTGGDALFITDSTITDSAYGGNGLRVFMFLPFLTDRTVYIDSSTLTGGHGGIISLSSSLTEDAKAYGGGGYSTGQSQVYASDSSMIGGDGGVVKASGGAFVVNVSGGDGLFAGGGPNQVAIMALTNVYAEGGSGGSATTTGAISGSSANGGNGITLSGSKHDNFVLNSQAVGGEGGNFNNGDGVAMANGGAGFAATNITASLVISNSTLTGGAGGTAVGAAGSTANGGAGLKLVKNSNVTITNSILAGGSAGSGGSDGASLEIQGSTVALFGGQLVGELLFSGTNTSALTIQGTLMDEVRQTGGTADINAWDASHFQNTTIETGTMNFNGTAFNLDGIFALGAETAAANFNNGLTVRDGATLNLGLGTVTGPSVILRPGGQIETTFDGSTLGQIDATDITINNGVQWTINAGSVVITNGASFDLATASGTLIYQIGADDVALVGSGGEFGWLGTINALNTSAPGVLTATYGASDLDVALGVDGDTSSDFGKAMGALSLSVTNGTPAYGYISDNYSSADAARPAMTNGFLRTAEMASTLVGLQSMFADQVQDRVRSQLRFDEVGYPRSSSPLGAAGWEAMRSWSDRMESMVNVEGIRNLSDSIENRFGYSDVMGAMDAVVPDVSVDETDLPPEWQTWGRGYGSYIEQDKKDGFASYEARIGGAMLGLDKSFGNLLMGVGAGYTRTVVDGASGHDAVADTGHGVAYLSAHGERLFFDVSATYALNAVETKEREFQYRGKYDAHTAGLYLGGGVGVSLFGVGVLTPEASILNTLYQRDAYVERSYVGFADKDYDSYDQWSHLTQLGATLSSVQDIDIQSMEMGIQPELRAHWLHEFNDEMDDETYTMNNVSGLSAALVAREEDLVKVGASLRFVTWALDTTEASFDVDGIFGSDGYDAYVVSGRIIHRF